MTQMDERIIIGHENDIKKSSKSIEISQEVLKKYDGKSREVFIKLLHFINKLLLKYSIVLFLGNYKNSAFTRNRSKNRKNENQRIGRLFG